MSPKDSLDFDAEDDIIELTDIVEQGSPPPMQDAGDDLFDTDGSDIDFEKELEDLFADSGDDAPAASSVTPGDDGLDFESDLDDLLGDLEGDAETPSESGSADTDDSFAAELDDLLGGLDDTSDDAQTASTAEEDDLTADLDALLGGLDSDDDTKDSGTDDLLDELGLGPDTAPATSASDDMDFSDLDALIDTMDNPGAVAGARNDADTDDSLPDLSDLDNLFEEAAADAMQSATDNSAPAVGEAPGTPDEGDDMDLDALLDSLDAAPAAEDDTAPADMATPDDNDTDMDDLDALLAGTSDISEDTPHVATAAPATPDTDDAVDAPGASSASETMDDTGDMDDIDALLDSLEPDPTDAPATPASSASSPSVPEPEFDPNESLSAPDMGDLDALLGDLGDDTAVAQPADDDIPELDDVLASAPEALDATPATEQEEDLDALEALLAASEPADTTDATDTSEAAMPDISGLPDAVDMPELELDASAPGTHEEALELDDSDLSHLQHDTDDAVTGLEEAEDSLDALDEADIDEMLHEMDESAEDDASVAAAVPGTVDMAALMARLEALERAISPNEEHIEDIVTRKIAEAAAEDEACSTQACQSPIHEAIENALAEGSPVMERITSMLDSRIDERLSLLEKSVFTHKDWTTLSRELKEELTAGLDKAAAKAAAEIIREELTTLLSEE